MDDYFAAIFIFARDHYPDVKILTPSIAQGTYAEEYFVKYALTMAPQHAGLPEASLLSPFAAVTATLEAHWDSEAWNTFQATALTATNAALYDAFGLPLGGGTVYATPLLSTTLALAHGAPLQADLAGRGRASFYAPATSGLGVAGKWETCTAQLSAASPYTLTLFDALVTLNGGRVYSGTFLLVVTSTTAIEGAGRTAVPNFAPHAALDVQEARVVVGPAGGTFLVGGQPVDVSNGVALAGYSGPLTITAATSATDHIALAGDASFFTLHLSPTAGTTDPNTPITFRALISANFTDTYTVTATAPEGWGIAIDETGRITATPPLGAAPGEYAVLVTARSATYPDLFVSALHTVTTTSYQGMALEVAEDTLITVPMGRERNPDALPGDVNTGRAQVPGAAFTIRITNTSTTAHTFRVEVDPTFPANWGLLSGAEGRMTTTLELPAGGAGELGFYISPTGGAPLLPPGATYPFTVTATAVDSPTLAQADTGVFTMPALTFPYLATAPRLLYAAPDTPATFDLGVTNVGNVGGAFAVTLTLPVTTWTALPISFATPDLAPEATFTQAVTLTPTGAAVGEDYVVAIRSRSGNYTPTAYLVIRIVNAHALCGYRAAETVAELGDVPLSAGLQDLAGAVGRLEEKPTDITRRDRAVAAIRAVVRLLAEYPALPVTDALRETAHALGTHTDPQDIRQDLDALCGNLSDLQEQLTALTQHDLVLDLAPGAAAVLPGQTITYTMRIANRGTLTTTYEVSRRIGESASYTVTLGAGQEWTASVPLTPTTLGWSKTANDAVTLTFRGSWVSLGFLTKSNAGMAEVLLDGFSRGIVDTYSAAEDVAAFFYTATAGLTHTLTLRVTGEKNPASSDAYVHLDYLDAWDGTSMPAGTFEQEDPRVHRSGNWTQVNDPIAGSGAYYRGGYNAWFLFTGDAVTYQAIRYPGAGSVEVLIDGVGRGTFSLGGDKAVYPISFSGLGPGPHVLRIRPAAGTITMDAFIVPEEMPAPTPTPTPSPTPVVTPTETPAPTPSPTPVVTPTETPVPTPSPTPVVTPTETPVPTPSPTPVVTPTETPVPTPSPTPVVTPTETPAPTPSPTPVVTPTETPAPTPSPTPVVTATATPTPTPSPSATPAETPSETPTPTATPGGGAGFWSASPLWTGWPRPVTSAHLAGAVRPGTGSAGGGAGRPHRYLWGGHRPPWPRGWTSPWNWTEAPSRPGPGPAFTPSPCRPAATAWTSSPRRAT